MFYFSAGLAIIGAVLYQYFVKLVPGSINPVVSVIGQYVAALVLGICILPLFPVQGGLWLQVRQLNWIQLALAVSVVLIELGFLLMYRAGWNLSTGNLVTGVVIPDVGLSMPVFRGILSGLYAVFFLMLFAAPRVRQSTDAAARDEMHAREATPITTAN